MPLNDAKTRLIHLCDSVSDRTDMPITVRRSADQIASSLREATQLVIPVGEQDVALLFSAAIAPTGAVSIGHIMKVLERAYTSTIKHVGEQKAAGLGLPRDLAVEFSNRQVRLLGKAIDDASLTLKKSKKPEERRSGQALWFIAQGVRSLAPQAQPFRISSCVYCHRHANNPLACDRHRQDGRYVAPIRQRELFVAAKQAQARHLAEFIQSNEALISELAGASDKNAPRVLRRASAAVHGPRVKSLLAKASEAAGSGHDLPSLANAWYALPEVDDELGRLALGQTTIPSQLVMLWDLSRLEAFEEIGRDQIKRPKTALSAQDLKRIVSLRRGGSTLTQIAETMGCSVSLAHRIVKEHAFETTREGRRLENEKIAEKAAQKVIQKAAKKAAKETAKKAAANTGDAERASKVGAKSRRTEAQAMPKKPRSAGRSAAAKVSAKAAPQRAKRASMPLAAKSKTTIKAR